MIPLYLLLEIRPVRFNVDVILIMSFWLQQVVVVRHVIEIVDDGNAIAVLEVS